ncbi:MAG TPA: glycosyltransferase 87 family protein [Stellaceae bacterium]|nr:glycosyltransferase 87 family protein [Stellaceae bacterium]
MKAMAMSSATRLILAEIGFSLLVFALQKVPRGWGWTTLALVGAIIAALPFMLALGRRRGPTAPQAMGRVLLWGIMLFTTAQLLFAIAMLVKPKVLDIGATTLAAALALAQGGNPYTMPIDVAAGGIARSAQFHGYKYLPMMIIIYAPLCLAFGIRGIILTNVLLQAMVAGLVSSLAGRTGERLAGLAAALLYLSLPFVAHQVFTRGVTDLAPTLLLLAAIRFGDERPFAAGVMVGFSIATKLLPGIVMLPCALPARGRRGRYLLGVLCGLLPILPFAAAAPEAFAANIILFNMVRPVDDTSWLFALSPVAVSVVRLAVVGLLALIAFKIWRRAPRFDERCILTTLAILAAFAVGPGMHHNYYLWFLPFLAILAGRAAIGAPAVVAPAATTSGRRTIDEPRVAHLGT